MEDITIKRSKQATRLGYKRKKDGMKRHIAKLAAKRRCASKIEIPKISSSSNSDEDDSVIVPSASSSTASSYKLSLPKKGKVSKNTKGKYNLLFKM